MASGTMRTSQSSTSLQPVVGGPTSGLQHVAPYGWGCLQPHNFELPGSYAVLPEDHGQLPAQPWAFGNAPSSQVLPEDHGQLPAPPWAFGNAAPSQVTHVSRGFVAADSRRRLPAPPVQGLLPS